MTDAIETAEEKTRLDRLLRQAPVPAVTAVLERRILADFDRHQARRRIFARLLRRAADTVWPDAPMWQPACAFALALLIGAGVAAFAPFDIPQQDDTAAFALDASPDIDAGQGI
jgi:hypothetical protein